MKWLKFKQAHKNYKVGEIVDIENDGAADTLVETGFAEVTTEPKEIAAGADALSKSLAEFSQKMIKESVDAAVGKLTKSIDQRLKSNRPRIGIIHDNEDDDPSMGFKNITDQTRAIMTFYKQGQRSDDPRIVRVMGLAEKVRTGEIKAPTTFSSEGFGADGGFLLAPIFMQELYEWVFADEGLMNRCDMLTTTSNNLTIPKDETTPWGSVGVIGAWTAEATQITQRKPQLGQDVMILQKYSVLVPATDEMLQDSFTGLGPYITRKAGANIRFAADEAIINGTGAGQPLGINNSPSVVTATVPALQVGTGTPTVLLPNIAQMISRIPSQSLSRLVWLIHPSAYPQIVVLANANSSLYIGPGEVENKAAIMGRLLGIPVVISQHCQAVGTPGDIYLLDLSQYAVLTKGTGIEAAMSIHLYFDYNISTFRFNFRMAGQPWFKAPITSLYGNYQLSPFVNLALRS